VRDFILTMAAALISTMAIPMLLQTGNNWRNTVAAVQAAQVAQELGDATKRYIAANYRSFAPNSDNLITLTQLKQQGFLPFSKTGCTSYGCNWVIEVKGPQAATPNDYEAMVMSQFPQPLPDRVNAVIAANIGATGGVIPTNDSRVYGSQAACSRVSDLVAGTKAYGISWQQDLTPYTSATCGQIAVLVSFDSSVADDLYFHRSYNNGLVQYNTLLTPLILGALKRAGDQCNQKDTFNAYPEPKGSVTSDANGNFLLCDGAVWVQVNNSVWKGPASANYAALPNDANNVIGDTRITADNNRAYSWDGSKWVAIGFDQNGNLTVPGYPNGANQGRGSIFLKSQKDSGYAGIIADGFKGEVSIVPEDSNTHNTANPSYLKVTANGVQLPINRFNGSCNTPAYPALPGTVAYDDNLGQLVICRQSGPTTYLWKPVGSPVQGIQAQISNNGYVTLPQTSCPGSAPASYLVSIDPTVATGRGPYSFVKNDIGKTIDEWSGNSKVLDNSAPFTVITFCRY
jgi:hypothetical protein